MFHRAFLDTVKNRYSRCFFHPDFNRWFWNFTKSAVFLIEYGSWTLTTSGELHPALKQTK